MAVSVFREVLQLGVNSNASDWHIRQDAPVAIRISGELTDCDFIADTQAINTALQQMASPELLERFHAHGDLDLSYVEDGVGRFRVNFHRQKGTIAMTLRYVRANVADMEQLGLPPILKSIADSERGIIILSGTTGCGKSTTLATMIEYINCTQRNHIITIEDPIEYEFKDKKSIVEQREVGLDTDTFESALVHVLRQDPDIIMIGEMRNKQSFDAALQAADTGHLVLTTLHSTNAPQAVTRILDFYDQQEHNAIRSALAVNLKSIICQRLIPKAYGGGITPAVEIMINNPIVRKLLEENKLEKLSAAVETGKEDGMQSFNQSLLKLVNEGLITEEDAIRNASNPDALKMNLKGIFLDNSSQIIG